MAITDVMGIFILVLLVVICGAVLVFRNLFAARKRKDVLEHGGQVSTWREIQSHPDRFVKFVQTDFGYGREIWALSTAAHEIDLQLRAFKRGILIAPPPKLSELREFCQSRAMELDLVMVKPINRRANK